MPFSGHGAQERGSDCIDRSVASVAVRDDSAPLGDKMLSWWISHPAVAPDTLATPYVANHVWTRPGSRLTIRKPGSRRHGTVRKERHALRNSGRSRERTIGKPIGRTQ